MRNSRASRRTSPPICAKDSVPNAQRQVGTKVARLTACAAVERELELHSDPRLTSGKRRELWIVQRSARLTPAELERVNQLLNEVLDTFENSHKSDSDEKLYLLTSALSPYGKR